MGTWRPGRAAKGNSSEEATARPTQGNGWRESMAPQLAILEAIGNAQQLFADNAKAKREELMETGQCEPFTIVNFNPPPLGLQGELQRYRVPSPDDPRLPAGVLRVHLNYDGRDRVGHALTVRDPHIYGRNVSATWHPGGGPGDAVVQREVMYYTPMAIAYKFLEHYSPIFVTGTDGRAAPPPKDQRKIYGVLAYKGDIHHLERLLEETDPARRKIEVPLAVVRSSGKTMQISYRAVAASLDDYLARMFEGQLRFADATISRAQQRWNGTDEDRKDISAADRMWYRWAINLGYADAPKPGEKTWLNELVTLRDTTQPAGTPGGLRKCQSCRKPEPEANTPFCPGCGAPINTFQTFMAGFPVAEAWLMALRGEEREIALDEMKLRRQGFDGPAPDPQPDAPKTNGTKTGARGAYKGKGTSRDNIPPAASAAMPGEE